MSEEEKSVMNMFMFDIPEEMLEAPSEEDIRGIVKEEEKFDEELCELLFKVEDLILTRERNRVYESALRRVRRMERLLSCPKRRRKKWETVKTSSSEARISSSQ